MPIFISFGQICRFDRFYAMIDKLKPTRYSVVYSSSTDLVCYIYGLWLRRSSSVLMKLSTS